MDQKELKKYLAKRAKELNKEWAKEVDEGDRKRPIDYVKTSLIDGKLNMVLEIQTLIS